MKKIYSWRLYFSLILLAVVLLAGCAEKAEPAAYQQIQPIRANVQETPGTKDEETGKTLELDYTAISSITIRDRSTDEQVRYINKTLIREFCSFLKSKKYSAAGEEWDRNYEVELFDSNDAVFLKIGFGSASVYFYNDILLDGKLIKKGLYDIDGWVWDYLQHLFYGTVLDPEFISYPAQIKVSGEVASVEMVSMGSKKVNSYDTYPALYDFAADCLIDKEFDILYSRKVTDFESMEAEIQKIRNESNCIVVNFVTSETYLEIDSANEYRETAKATSLTLAKGSEEPGIFKLVTDNMVFEIKTDSDLANNFDAVFSGDGKASKVVAPDEIRTLFNSRKPYYMEYISRNLGINDWNGNYPDKLEIKEMKLGDEEKPYLAVNLSNMWDLRMLFFEEDGSGSWSFVDFIDYGGRNAGAGYRLEKAGEHVWLTGNRCMGYGTGVVQYYQQWYTLYEEGRKIVLGFPYEEYLMNPSGGYGIKADDIDLEYDGTAKVSVNYTVKRFYSLELDIADEYGNIEIEGKKRVIFTWDDSRESFISEYEPDNTGITRIPPECDELTRKCDEILELNYDQLLKAIMSIPKEEDRHTQDLKIHSIETFLDDCTDSEKKLKLIRQLDDIKEL